MSQILTAQICENGHIVNGAIEEEPQRTEAFCSKCGAKTITSCPNCNSRIRGEINNIEPGFYAPNTPASLPSYCYSCGQPYPWTEKALNNAKLLIQEEEGFSSEQITMLVNSLPDVIVETPSTNLTMVRIKKALLTAGKFTAEGLRQFIIDFGCELAKKNLGS